MNVNFKKREKKMLMTLLIFLSIGFTQQTGHQYIEYQQIQNELQQGWDTWNTSSALIDRWGSFSETVRPGPHAYDGSYTQLEIGLPGVEILPNGEIVTTTYGH